MWPLAFFGLDFQLVAWEEERLSSVYFSAAAGHLSHDFPWHIGMPVSISSPRGGMLLCSGWPVAGLSSASVLNSEQCVFSSVFGGGLAGLCLETFYVHEHQSPGRLRMYISVAFNVSPMMVMIRDDPVVICYFLRQF